MSKRRELGDGSVQNLPLFLAIDTLIASQICSFLQAQHIGVLDIAVSSHSARELWLTMMKSATTESINKWRHSPSSIRWMIMRNVHVTEVLVSLEHCDEVLDVTFETSGTDRFDVAASGDERAPPIYSIWEGFQYLEVVDLGHCMRITDISVSAVARGCGQLHTINFLGCSLITDIGISALAHGCGQLRMIDLGDCSLITDTGLSALAHGCGQLTAINLTDCDITDIGISALAHGCGQLHTIDLYYCNLITDIGISALAHGCRQLCISNLNYCSLITDIGVSALGHGCGQLHTIDQDKSVRLEFSLSLSITTSIVAKMCCM